MATLPVDPQLYLAYLGVMSVMAITPGPANLFSVAAGMEKGRRYALISIVGMNTATLVWFVAAALGLGALVTAFPDVFRYIAMAGAAYVAWLGIKSIHAAFTTAGDKPSEHAALRQKGGAFLSGFMVQIANPKAILFFTAVLPPFIDVQRPVVPQLALFAAAVLVMDVIAMSSYAFCGAALADRMQQPAFRKGFGVFVGLLLLSAAIMIISRT